jgi:hypothetical protein
MPGVTWPTLRTHQLRQDLANVRQTLLGYPDADAVKALLARFYVVRSCGLVETVAVECGLTYLAHRSDARSHRYGSSWLPWRITSAQPGALLDFVGRYDATWREELEVFLKADDEFLWRELAGLVQKRNRIAHGESETVSAHKALEYGEVAGRVCDWLQVRFDPS